MIGEYLAAAYPWTKSLHVISVIAWMAGLFYLPRLFVYHAEKVGTGTETDALLASAWSSRPVLSTGAMSGPGSRRRRCW